MVTFPMRVLVVTLLLANGVHGLASDRRARLVICCQRRFDHVPKRKRFLGGMFCFCLTDFSLGSAGMKQVQMDFYH